MSNAWHTYGPPGTGKTRALALEASDMVGKYGAKSVMICSLTRAAAKEIAGRGSHVADDMIGTLHSHAYRALEQPEMVNKHIEEWNKECKSTHLLLTGSKDDDFAGTTEGDRTLAASVVLRSMMIPREEWKNPTVKAFDKKWTEWKEANEYLDFTDLIERCLRDVPKPPGDPMVMMGDEAQDWSKLEAKLFREHWGQHVDMVRMSGDEDQTIFGFRGADPHIFTGHPIPPEQERVLEQSYRVPRAVHKVAISWIRNIKNRKDVIYHPKDEPGEVRRRNFIYKDPVSLVNEVIGRVKKKESVMILASCSYMLQGIIKQLRIRGVPFHNPYRRESHNWNPLHTSKDKVSTMERLKAFLEPDNDNEANTNPDRWTKYAMQLWIPLLKSRGLLWTSTKKAVESGDFHTPKELHDWHGNFFKDPDDVDPVLSADRGWLLKNILPSKKKSVEFPLRIIDNGFADDGIYVIIGTVHSVKGGEADHVYVFPDVSSEALYGGDQEALIRLFYVAMTRAIQSLTLCGPSSGNSVRW
jgi:superfamily I DNA/RNA helicase